MACVKDNLFIKTFVVANKGDAQLDLIFADKEVLLTETNVLLTADTSSEEEDNKKIEPGFSLCCMLGGPEKKGQKLKLKIFKIAKRRTLFTTVM